MSPTIQALSRSHIPTILEACNDWEELSQFGAPYWRPRSEAELERKVASTNGPSPAGEYNFVITDHGRAVGECSLHSIDLRSRVAQIGVCVWSPGDRGKGYGRFGVEQMVAFGFGSLGLLRLEAWVLDSNSPLTGTLQGVRPQRYFINRCSHDMHVLGLLNTVS